MEGSGGRSQQSCVKPSESAKRNARKTLNGRAGCLRVLLLRDAIGLTAGCARALVECRAINGWRRHNALLGLRHLELTGNAFVSDELLRRLAQAAPSVKTLSLCGCSNVGAATALAALGTAMRRLTHLDLSNCTHLTDAAVRAFANALSDDDDCDHSKGRARAPLKRLDLSHCSLRKRRVKEIFRSGTFFDKSDTHTRVGDFYIKCTRGF